MATRWINNYHKGFNRLWLVIALIPTLVVSLYQMRQPRLYYNKADAQAMEEHNKKVHENWKPTPYGESPARGNPPTLYYRGSRESVFQTCFRVFRYTLVTFIIIFGFGHGVFLVIYWIIKGFRKS